MYNEEHNIPIHRRLFICSDVKDSVKTESHTLPPSAHINAAAIICDSFCVNMYNELGNECVQWMRTMSVYDECVQWMCAINVYDEFLR